MDLKKVLKYRSNEILLSREPLTHKTKDDFFSVEQLEQVCPEM